MNLEQLTSIEESILKRMPYNGVFEERHEYLKSGGVYLEWQNLFDEYVNLAIDGNDEALKRALFMVWFETSEPNSLTGLLCLDKNKVACLIIYLNNKILFKNIDKELVWMLPYYYMVSEWYIPNNLKADSLIKFSLQGSELYKTHLNKCDFKGRGQLGLYWCSIQF